MERTPEIRALEKHIWHLEEEIKKLETLTYNLQKQIQARKLSELTEEEAGK